MNQASILSTNIIGVLLLVCVAMGSVWRLQNSRENRILKGMFWLVLSGCIVEPAVDLLLGHPGKTAHVLCFLGSTWTYALNALVSWLWLVFIDSYMAGGDRWQALRFSVPMLTGMFLLVLNFFLPVCFSIDEQNNYVRYFGFFVFFAISVIYQVSVLFRYAHAKKRGGILKFFPVWGYALPALLGAAVQTVVYGTAVLWPCAAVSITGVASALQNELIYRDELTGLYNRSYLTALQNRMAHGSSAPITGVMLDLNGFKTINDRFGHAKGDEALIQVADILREAVGEYGSVVRYAGDEFVLLINSCEEPLVQEVLDRVHGLFAAFNESGREAYCLSAAMGAEIFDPGQESADEFMNRIDKRMYEDKERCYASAGAEA